LDLTNQSGFNILALLVASDELILNKLVDYVQKHIIDKESSWLQKNLVAVLQTVFKLQSCETIQVHIMKTICKDPKPFFELKEFPTLDKDILLKLVMRDDLDFDEINIWKYLVKWGTTQSVTSRGRSKAATFYEDLSNDFSQFLEESEDYDVVIQVGEKSDFKEFNAHSNILRARSPYFKTALSSRWATHKDGVITFKKPNIKPVVFLLILR
ncbi:32132_t:CDS:2, partial [Racocetra persica]